MNNISQFQTIKIVLEETQILEIKQIISELITDELKQNVTNQNSPYLNKKQACDYLDISNNTLDSWIKQGLPTIRIGKTVRFDKNEVHKWLQKQ